MILLEGKIKDNLGLAVVQAQVFLSNSAGDPVKDSNGKALGTISDGDGNYKLPLPVVKTLGINVPVAKYITVRSSGFSSKVQKIYKGQTVYNFALGGGTQEVVAVTVTAPKKETVAGLEVSEKNPWRWAIYAGIGLLVLGTTIAIIKKKRNG